MRNVTIQGMLSVTSHDFTLELKKGFEWLTIQNMPHKKTCERDHCLNAEIHLLHLITLSMAEDKLLLIVHGYRVPWQCFTVL